MPELPEVEILVRHLRPLLAGKAISSLSVFRSRVLLPTNPPALKRRLRGARFVDLERRGKYLLFKLQPPDRRDEMVLVGHLGMTGRMYLLPNAAPLPKHAAVVLDLDEERFVFEDTRYFGKFTLDTSPLKKLGPEPLGPDFTSETFAGSLKKSSQAIKVKLLDQSLVAGVGNIYANEALFRAGIPPKRRSAKLKRADVEMLWRALREVLSEAIQRGSTIPLAYSGNGTKDGLFYFGRASGAEGDGSEEQFRVYDREGEPCLRCGTSIKRIVQAARSTFYCPVCQRSKAG